MIFGSSSSDPAAWRELATEVHAGVFSFPLFTPEYCTQFLSELDNYYASGLPIRRPNSMNNYGIIVNEIGMEPMIDALQKSVLQPLARVLYPVEGACLDHHHSFTTALPVSRAHFVGGRGAAPRRGYPPAKMLSWVALHLAVAFSALDGDESSRRELDVNYSDQCKNLATKSKKAVGTRTQVVVAAMKQSLKKSRLKLCNAGQIGTSRGKAVRNIASTP